MESQPPPSGPAQPNMMFPTIAPNDPTLVHPQLNGLPAASSPEKLPLQVTVLDSDHDDNNPPDLTQPITTPNYIYDDDDDDSDSDSESGLSLKVPPQKAFFSSIHDQIRDFDDSAKTATSRNSSSGSNRRTLRRRKGSSASSTGNDSADKDYYSDEVGGSSSEEDSNDVHLSLCNSMLDVYGSAVRLSKVGKSPSSRTGQTNMIHSHSYANVNHHHHQSALNLTGMTKSHNHQRKRRSNHHFNQPLLNTTATKNGPGAFLLSFLQQQQQLRNQMNRNHEEKRLQDSAELDSLASSLESALGSAGAARPGSRNSGGSPGNTSMGSVSRARSADTHLADRGSYSNSGGLHGAPSSALVGTMTTPTEDATRALSPIPVAQPTLNTPPPPANVPLALAVPVACRVPASPPPAYSSFYDSKSNNDDKNKSGLSQQQLQMLQIQMIRKQQRVQQEAALERFEQEQMHYSRHESWDSGAMNRLYLPDLETAAASSGPGPSVGGSTCTPASVTCPPSPRYFSGSTPLTGNLYSGMFQAMSGPPGESYNKVLGPCHPQPDVASHGVATQSTLDGYSAEEVQRHLDHLDLLNEAASRAQVSVMIRDFEEQTL